MNVQKQAQRQDVTAFFPCQVFGSQGAGAEDQGPQGAEYRGIEMRKFMESVLKKVFQLKIVRAGRPLAAMVAILSDQVRTTFRTVARSLCLHLGRDGHSVADP